MPNGFKHTIHNRRVSNISIKQHSQRLRLISSNLHPYTQKHSLKLHKRQNTILIRVLHRKEIIQHQIFRDQNLMQFPSILITFLQNHCFGSWIRKLRQTLVLLNRLSPYFLVQRLRQRSSNISYFQRLTMKQLQ